MDLLAGLDAETLARVQAALPEAAELLEAAQCATETPLASPGRSHVLERAGTERKREDKERKERGTTFSCICSFLVVPS